ncbi:MAG: hypothetical protein LUG64_02140 [Clostridiales bacterium]|nr:hypothetical protein [Clostridiales bacterium]
MTREEIVDTMWEADGHRIHCIENNGDEWTGYVDVFESAYDNQDDEKQGASICVQRDDGYNVIVYEDYIKEIEIID